MGKITVESTSQVDAGGLLHLGVRMVSQLPLLERHVGARWVVERTQAWMNGYGKLRRCTETRGATVDFYLFLAAAAIVVRWLTNETRTRYRWDTCPTTRRLT